MLSATDRTFLSVISGLVARRMGLNFGEDRWPELARGVEQAGAELGFDDLAACASWLAAGELTDHQVETLASHLTVGETYFFREPASFELLEREILPELAAARAAAGRTLRLWSAGCSTGEEAYTLAITCGRALVRPATWSVSILATDINSRALARAEAGVFSEWSFRGTPAWVRAGHFSPAPGRRLAIDPALRKLVEFAYLNLAEDPYPALHNHTNAMDVILCRNVLMYFTPEHQRRIVAALHRCLVDGGVLFVSPAEASASLFSMFELEDSGGVLRFRKTSRASRPVTGPAAGPPLPAPDAVWPVPLPAAAAPGPIEPLPMLPRPAPGQAPSGEQALRLARSYADQGRLEEALAICREAASADRTNPASYLLAAAICGELGRLEEAVRELGKLLYLDQDSILGHHELAGLYRRLGKEKKSSRHLAVARELLSARSRTELVPDSDGMTCGRLLESVRAMTGA